MWDKPERLAVKRRENREFIGPSPSGKAPGFDPGIRWFDKIARSDFGRPQGGPAGAKYRTYFAIQPAQPYKRRKPR